jgi:hypothetical protein
MALSGKLTRKLVENLRAGRHGDGNGLYLVVDQSGAQRWIVRVVVKGQKNKKGAPLARILAWVALILSRSTKQENVRWSIRAWQSKV